MHYVNHKLEEMQQQDFSDCAHAPLWRDIVRDLVEVPRYVFSTWIKSHTTAMDPDHAANRIVDRLAKEAARDRISYGAPDMSLDHTPIVHSRVRHEKPAYLELDQGIASLNDSAPGAPLTSIWAPLSTTQGRVPWRSRHGLRQLVVPSSLYIPYGETPTYNGTLAFTCSRQLSYLASSTASNAARSTKRKYLLWKNSTPAV